MSQHLLVLYMKIYIFKHTIGYETLVSFCVTARHLSEASNVITVSIIHVLHNVHVSESAIVTPKQKNLSLY